MWELTRRSITLATPPFSMMEGKRRGRVAHDNGLYLSRDDLLGFEKYAVINTHSDTYRGEEAGRMGRSWGGRKKKRRREDVSYMCSCLFFIFFFFFFFFLPLLPCAVPRCGHLAHLHICYEALLEFYCECKWINLV